MYGLVGLVFLVLPIIAGIVGYGTASKRSSGIRRLGYLGRIAGLIVGTIAGFVLAAVVTGINSVVGVGAIFGASVSLLILPSFLIFRWTALRFIDARISPAYTLWMLVPLVQLGIILWALLAPSRSLPSGRLAAAFD